MHKASFFINFLLVLGCGWLPFCGTNKTLKTPTEQSTSDEGNTPKPSIVQKIKERQHLPVGERIAWYLQLKKENAEAYNFENEDELTMYGYSLLWEDKEKCVGSSTPNCNTT
jgi:hypothetical protein